MKTVILSTRSPLFFKIFSSVREKRTYYRRVIQLEIVKLVTLALIGGTLYVLIEFAWRGRSHGSMFLDGGICFVLIGLLNELAPTAPISVQAMLGACIITTSELAVGLTVNRSYTVWDYRALRPNFLGQVCLCYFTLWIPLSVFAIYADDVLRALLFHQPRPPILWF